MLGGAGAPVEMAIQHIPPAGYVAAPSLVGDAEPELRAAAQFSRGRQGRALLSTGVWWRSRGARVPRGTGKAQIQSGFSRLHPRLLFAVRATP